MPTYARCQVPLPWSTEHCIGLQRVMMRVSEVMQPFHYQQHDKYKDVSLEVTHQDHVNLNSATNRAHTLNLSLQLSL